MRRALPLLLVLASVAIGSEDAIRVDASDGPLSVVLSVEPAAPAIGQEVRLSLRAAVDAAAGNGVHVEWPDLRAAVEAAFGEDVVEVRDVRRRPDGRGIDAGLRLYDTGTFELPALRVRAWPASGSAADVALADVQVSGAALVVPLPETVTGAPVPGRGTRAWEAVEGGMSWLWAAIAAAALLLVGALLLLARRRRDRLVPKTVVAEPAHERALSALRALVARRLPEQGDVDAYFVSLTGILRHYVEERFGLRAPEQTTEEFLAAVGGTAEGRRAIDAAQREVLSEILTAADLVKFARDEPGVTTCAAAAEHAERFVADTAPPPSPGPEEPA